MNRRNILQRLTALLLCAVTLCGLLGGCKKPGDDSESTASPGPDLNLKESVLDVVITEDTPAYSKPDVESSQAATLHAGITVSCTELLSLEDTVWGKTVYGWIQVGDYVPPETSADDPSAPTVDPNAKAILGVVTATKLNVRKGAGTDYDIVDELYAGEPVNIYEVITVGKSYWGRTDDGWVAMSYVYEPGKVGKNRCNAVVMEGNVPVYDWPGIREDSTGTLKKGQRIDVLQRITMGDEVWGCYKGGWVCLSDLYVEGKTGKNACTGTVTASDLNVRSGPGTDFKKVTSYSKGKRVEILEQIHVDGTAWGYTGKGWVSMDYIRQETNTETKGK